jgi:predicted MPP superfamily phosphohydrolase
MTVHTKWEILVQKLLKSVELFKSYGLFAEPKVFDFLFFGKMLKTKNSSSRKPEKTGSFEQLTFMHLKHIYQFKTSIKLAQKCSNMSDN